jgi:hypothetical protein
MFVLLFLGDGRDTLHFLTRTYTATRACKVGSVTLYDVISQQLQLAPTVDELLEEAMSNIEV